MKTLLHHLAGFGILVACLLTGNWLKDTLNLVLPGSILGLFLLLALLSARIIPLRWVEPAARLLLWLLPFLFLPIFVLALGDHSFWTLQGGMFALAVIIGTILSWAIIGHAAQRLLRKES